MARFGEINAQYFDDAGDPLSSGKIYFYESGTTTLKTTYSDINFTIPNTNPVILTAAGRQPNIFFDGNAKAILTDKNDVQIIVRDPVGDTAGDFGDAWIATKIYSTDAVVLGSDGVYYRSLVAANQNNNPTTTSGYWTLLYSVQWNAGITYQEGAVVTYDGEQYQSLQNSNLNNNPSSATAYWASIAFAWLSTRTYAINENVVGTDGILYTSLQNSNTGNVPASSGSYWVGTSAAAAASATTASEWAIKNSAAVSGTDWSAFANASGAAPTGSSKAWATTAEDSVVAGGEYSAKHYSAKSSASATASAASATTATTKASEAATSASTATTKASEAATSATNAATSATNSATSATASANSATAAASSATDAANKYDEFDDRYLGQKSSDPSTDNDGNALVTGAIYFNTTTNVMRVYNGSAWQNVAPTATSITLSQVTDVTATAAEVNLNDGSVAGTIVNGKTVVYGASGEVNATTLQVGGTAITSTPQELNVLDGIPATLTATELGYVDGVTSNIQTQFDSIAGTPLVQSFTANGAIASGKPVILETAGTVAEVSETTINPDAPIGSTTLVDGNNTEYINFAADPHNENRWVAVYADDIGNKNVYMKVFTRSGTTITQSSAIAVITGGAVNREPNVCFDKGQANVVLLMYNNNSNDGAVRVATISGSAGSESVSLGSETSFYTSQPIFTSSRQGAISLINLDTSGTFLGMWTDANAANNTLKGRVFQVSGTSVTAGGSTTNLATDSSGYGDGTNAIREHYSDTTKAYLAYRDTGAALAMKVLTVSGTSISVGTKYGSSTDVAGAGVSISPISSSKIIVSSVKNSGNYPSYHVVTDSSGTLSYGTYTTISSVSAQTVVGLNNTNNNALVFPVYYAYNGGSGTRPFVKILTSNSDGSTISLSSEDEIDTSNTISASWSNVALQEDDSGHYMWIGEISSDLYFILGKAGGSSTNLTSTNYIGIAEAAISDTASGNIMLRGGVSEKVSSLTAGSTYYVQADGTFATSAGSPSVEAGKALSATKLLLKGL